MTEKWSLSLSAVKKAVAGGVLGLIVPIERRVLHRCLGDFIAVETYRAICLLSIELNTPAMTLEFLVIIRDRLVHFVTFLHHAQDLHGNPRIVFMRDGDRTNWYLCVKCPTYCRIYGLFQYFNY